MKTDIKRVLILGVFLFCQIALMAQNRAKEFYISSFKPLEMDLDARTLHPVIDQNGKKAALIKVVTTHTGFDFDIGVMGITEVHQEVGEIWVYIPEKSQRITIRHPQFGVIRDYFFPVPIESATTYEMRLKTPSSASGENQPQRLVIEHKFGTREDMAKTIEKEDISKTTDMRNPAGKNIQKSHIMYTDYKGLILLAEVGASSSPSYGIRAGYYRELGGYVSFRSSFSSAKSSYRCTSDGVVENGGTIWTSGKDKVGRLNVTAGVIAQFTHWLGAYAGAGYGTRTIVWEDINGQWAEVSDFSYKSIALDAGLVFNIKNFAVSAGINSIAFDWCEITLGFGVRF